MAFPLPEQRDRNLFLHTHFLIEGLQSGKYDEDSIRLAPRDVWLLDLGLKRNRQCLSFRRFSSANNRQDVDELWNISFNFPECRTQDEKWTRNNQYGVNLIYHGRSYGRIHIYNVKDELSMTTHEHSGLKGYRWSQKPNVILTFSNFDVINWHLSAGASKQVYTTDNFIETIEVHGDILFIWHSDDTTQYRTIDGQRIPPQIEAILDQNEIDFPQSEYLWYNFADGTHIIQHAGSSTAGRSRLSIFHPSGTIIGCFEVEYFTSKNLVIYLNRFIAIAVKGCIYIYSKKGELLSTKQCHSSPEGLFPYFSGHLYYI